MKNWHRNYFIFLLFLTIALPEFGKNIVQYDKFEWYFIQTLHFDIYYYSDEESQIDFVASYTEQAYDKIQEIIKNGLLLKRRKYNRFLLYISPMIYLIICL